MQELKEIEQLYLEICLIQKELDKFDLSQEERTNNYKKMFSLLAKLTKLERNAYLKMEPKVVGDTLDLYLKNIRALFDDNPDEYNYIITLHDTKTIIGEIQVRFNNPMAHLGNIGTEIDEEYRGKHYAQQAYKMLHDTLLEKGVTKPIFTTSPTNLSAIRSLVWHGAKLVGEGIYNGQTYYVYEDDLLEKKENIK